MKIPVGLSNHHVHVTREVGEILFGKGHELTCKRELKQIGEFACEEVVDVIINGKTLEHVRLIGPYRKYTQVELLDRDCDMLGAEHIRRNSGNIEGTIAFELVGSNGKYSSTYGAFVANNHVHLSESEAKEMNLKAGEIVEVATSNGDVIDNVFIKSDPSCSVEFHLNKDEGEALGIALGDEVTIFSKHINKK